MGKLSAVIGLLLLGSGASLAAAELPKTIADCADCPQMVVIPAGSATLGSTAEERARAGIIPLFGDREGPTYKVTFAKPYAIGKTEITRAQYRAFVDATKRPDPPACGNHDPEKDFWGPRPGYNWRKPGIEQDDTHPAVCIGYDDAVAYTKWLSAKTGKPYRLPSDAEWEYAARGGTTTPWYWGERGEDGCGIANMLSSGTVAKLGHPKSMADRFVCASPRTFTMPVASFPPNPFGLYDMVGNAFEWAADCNSPDNRDARADGSARTTGDCARHYLKGGAFQTPFWLTRSAIRGAPLTGDIRMFAMGFRVARSID
jgi:formylglycine-generating enzyme